MWYKTLSIVAAFALAMIATPVLSEDTNVYDQFQCPGDGGGGSGGGEICICGCGSFANGNFWDCSPNGCDAKEGKTCTPSTRPANSRKTTSKEMTIIARLFPTAPKKSMQTCVMTKKKKNNCENRGFPVNGMPLFGKHSVKKTYVQFNMGSETYPRPFFLVYNSFHLLVPAAIDGWWGVVVCAALCFAPPLVDLLPTPAPPPIGVPLRTSKLAERREIDLGRSARNL